MLKVYILHYKPLIERKIFMDQQIEKQNINSEYVFNKDKEELDDYDKEIFDFKKVWNGRTLWLSNASLISKHIEAYQRIYDSKEPYSIILEDDVILCDNYLEKAYNYIQQLPNNWDILFFGDGYKGSMHVPDRVIKNIGGNVFLKSLSGNGISGRNENGWPICAGASRCSDNYVISYDCVTKILEHVKKIRNKKESRITRPSDFWMNQIFKQLNFKIYWGEPTLSTQGTENGTFKSAHSK